MLIFPNGPSILTVAPTCVRLTRAFGNCAGGGITSNVTFGGNDRGALPIFERRCVEVENREVRWRCANAGTRNAGSVVSRRAVGVELSRALDERMQYRVASMMGIGRASNMLFNIITTHLQSLLPNNVSKARANADITRR